MDQKYFPVGKKFADFLTNDAVSFYKRGVVDSKNEKYPLTFVLLSTNEVGNQYFYQEITVQNRLSKNSLFARGAHYSTIIYAKDLDRTKNIESAEILDAMQLKLISIAR